MALLGRQSPLKPSGEYTLTDLRKMAKSFIDRLPGATSEGIENGWKMFAIAYLNTRMDQRERESEGPALFRIIQREYTAALSKADLIATDDAHEASRRDDSGLNTEQAREAGQ